MARRKKIGDPEQFRKLVTSTEVEIAEMQLERLKIIATERLLTPDETKQYDILVKNIMLLRGQPTTISATASMVEELDTEELIQIALNPDNILIESDDEPRDN